MTPAINYLKKLGLAFQLHEYHHDPQSTEGYGMEAAHLLQQPPERVFKTLLVTLDHSSRQLAVAILPVNAQLNLKAMAKACGAKKVEMAETGLAERITGYLVGGISPLGQKKRLPTVLDQSADSLDTLFVSAGKRGLEVELSPQDLLLACQGKTSALQR